MAILIKTIYLLIATTISLYLYYWSSTFKKLGDATLEELNEGDEKKEDLVDKTETKWINRFSTLLFVLIGVFVWSFIAITVGKIASDITNHWIGKYPVYFFMYFIFLRFPFRVANKMVKKAYDFSHFHEKIIFAFVMILSYVLAICCYDRLPGFYKWPFQVLGI